MSSGKYSAEIRPEPTLRRVVLTSGIALAIAGQPLLCMLPLDLAAKMLACAAWGGWSVCEIARVIRSHRWGHGIRLAPGGAVAVLGTHGLWLRARLLPGSIVLRRLAWLRIDVEGKGAVFELVRGDCREGQDWRRLQVIWQHIGAIS